MKVPLAHLNLLKTQSRHRPWDHLALREIFFNVQATDKPDWSKVGADYLKAIKG